MERGKLFALAVKQMRRAQSNYFKCKDKAAKYELLKISIARENEVDAEAQAILLDQPQTLIENKILNIEEHG